MTEQRPTTVPGGGGGPVPPIPHPANFLEGLWNWINAQANHAVGAFVGSVENFAKTVGDAILANHGSLHTLTWALRQQAFWIVHGLRRLTYGLVWPLVLDLRRRIRAQWARTNKLVGEAIAFAVGVARVYVNQERAQRRREVHRAVAELTQRIRHLHQTIEREAASGYRTGISGRIGTASFLARIIENNNPLVRGIVSRIVAGLLDLLAVDNPVARLALGFLVKHLIDRLGVDKVAGRLLGDLLGPLAGRPRPHDLHDVIADISDRLGAIEAWEAQFMADGGPEILQAGQQWKAIAGPAGDVALLGILGLAVTHPDAFARDVTGALGVVVHDTIGAVHKLLKEV